MAPPQVRVEHPEYGKDFFIATLDASLSAAPGAPNEASGLRRLLR